MTDTEILTRLGDKGALVCTALGEARGDRREGGSSIEERIGSMCTVRNRLRLPARFGDTYKAVCLQRKQYSCWLPSDPNRIYLLAVAYRLITGQPSLDPLVDETVFLADGIMAGLILDSTKGATHYYSPAAMVPNGRVPVWAQGQTPTARIGGSIYFRGV